MNQDSLGKFVSFTIIELHFCKWRLVDLASLLPTITNINDEIKRELYKVHAQIAVDSLRTFLLPRG